MSIVLKNQQLRDDFCVRTWISETVSDDGNAAEFNDLIQRICDLDKQLGMDIEAEANSRVADAAVAGFLLGWNTRTNPARLVFKD